MEGEGHEMLEINRPLWASDSYSTTEMKAFPVRLPVLIRIYTFGMVNPISASRLRCYYEASLDYSVLTSISEDMCLTKLIRCLSVFVSIAFVQNGRPIVYLYFNVSMSNLVKMRT
jgi:hypothetical protein